MSDEKPKDVINTFFGAYRLSEIRSTLWNLVEVAMTCDSDLFAPADERVKLLWFYSQVEELIEAAYLLSDKRLSTGEKKKFSKM